MVSNNTDCNRNSDNNMGKMDSAGEPETSASALSKRTLRECQIDLGNTYLEKTDIFSNMTTTSSGYAGHSHQYPNNNLLTRLKGQKWHHYFDYEKVLKQMRYIEKLHIKMLEKGTQSSSTSSKTIPSAFEVTTESREVTHHKQVQRLRGNDMRYYGIAPRQEALDIVICNVCDSTYTKVGFRNHVIQQHAAIWSSLPKTITTTTNPTSKAQSDSLDDRFRDFDRIELSGISSDSSATAASSASSSSLSSLSSSTRSAKGHRRSATSENTSSSGRSRSKTSKQQQNPQILNALPNFPSPLVLSATSAVGEELMSNSSSSKAKKATSSALNPTATSVLVTTAEGFADISAKVLPTFGNPTDPHSSNNTSTVLGISSSYSNLSNSSSSSSSTSSTSSKGSSQSTTSSPLLAFPTILSVPFTETSQFEIASSSACFMDSGETGRKVTNFSSNSFDKTENNAILTNISNLRNLTTKSVALCSLDVPPPINNVSEQTVSNLRSNSPTLSLNPSLENLEKEHEKSAKSLIVKNDTILPPENIISSGINVVQSSIQQNDYSAKKQANNIEQLSLASVSTCDVTSQTQANLSSYSNLVHPTTTTEGVVYNNLDIDKICNDRTECETTSCTLPSTCNTHTHAAKRNFIACNKQFDEILAFYCAEKDGKAILSSQGVFNSSTNSPFVDLEHQTMPNAVSATNNFSYVEKTAVEDRNATKNLMKNDLSTLKTTKSHPEGPINNMVAQKKSQFQLQFCSDEKSKMEATHASAPSNSLPQTQQQVIEHLYDERTNNSLNDNPVPVLEGIFKYTPQLEMIDSKFITEILNNPGSDFSFEDLETFPTVQSISQQPATKRLRLDVNTVYETRGVDSTSNFFEQKQMQNFISNQSANVSPGKQRKIDINYNESAEQFQQQSDIRYQNELNCVMQNTPEKMTSTEVIQFQQLLYQQCSFNNFDILDHQQLDEHIVLNTNKEIDFSGENKNLEYGNDGNTANTSNHPTEIENLNLISQEPELTIDGESIDAVQSNFSILDIPSLTDDHMKELTIYNLFDTISMSQEGDIEHFTQPAEEELLLEIADNQVLLQEEQPTRELSTKADYTTFQIYFENKSNLRTSNENPSTNNNWYIEGQSSQALTYDFSHVETVKVLMSSACKLETKSKTPYKYTFDLNTCNINMFNCIPRPLSVNNFGLNKLPLTAATTFRKVLLTSRKANNSPIAFSVSVSTVVGNCVNGYIANANSHHNTGILRNVSNMSGMAGNVPNNILNDFSTGCSTIANTTTNSSHEIPPKQQKNGTMEVTHSHSNQNPNLTSMSNSSVQGITVSRNQKSLVNNALNCTTFGNGKNKTSANTGASVAVVNSTARLSPVHTIQNANNNNITNLSNSKNIKTIYIHNNSSLGTDHVNVLKRSPFDKLNTSKSMLFTPKLISELLMNKNFIAANLGILGSNYKTATANFARYRSTLYDKSRINKLDQRRSRMTNSTLKIARERKQKIRQLFLS